jgi:hypothetical protein
MAAHDRLTGAAEPAQTFATQRELIRRVFVSRSTWA